MAIGLIDQREAPGPVLRVDEVRVDVDHLTQEPPLDGEIGLRLLRAYHEIAKHVVGRRELLSQRLGLLSLPFERARLLLELDGLMLQVLLLVHEIRGLARDATAEHPQDERQDAQAKREREGRRIIRPSLGSRALGKKDILRVTQLLDRRAHCLELGIPFAFAGGGGNGGRRTTE